MELVPQVCGSVVEQADGIHKAVRGLRGWRHHAFIVLHKKTEAAGPGQGTLPCLCPCAHLGQLVLNERGVRDNGSLVAHLIAPANHDQPDMYIFYIGVGGIRDEEKQYSCLFVGLCGGGILGTKAGFAHIG